MAASLIADVEIVAEALLPGDANQAELAALVEHVIRAEAKSGAWTVTVAIVTDESLRRMHRDFMGIDSETDVMTFPVGQEPWEEAQGGDIAVSVDRAEDQAPDYGHTTWEEIRFLVAHGVLHLCGWDDAIEDDRRRMLERQRELIASFDHTDKV